MPSRSRMARPDGLGAGLTIRADPLYSDAMNSSRPQASAVEAPEAPVTVEPIEPALKAELLTHIDERGQVTVRCSFASQGFNLIRIWQSTFLVCRQTGHRSELLYADGIAIAPQWMPVLPGAAAVFTLVFAPLPKDCSAFDLIEDIPRAGGFHVSGIGRNERDLYEVGV